MKANKKKHKIAWEKFENPYQPPEGIEEAGDEYVDSYEDGEVKQMLPVVLTPQGPVGIYNLSDEVMNFWVGHTDFLLTRPIVHLIGETDGVESLEVFTPYRLRISIGKMFKPNIVMSSIGEKINTSLYSKSWGKSLNG